MVDSSKIQVLIESDGQNPKQWVELTIKAYIAWVLKELKLPVRFQKEDLEKRVRCKYCFGSIKIHQEMDSPNKKITSKAHSEHREKVDSANCMRGMEFIRLGRKLCEHKISGLAIGLEYPIREELV